MNYRPILAAALCAVLLLPGCNLEEADSEEPRRTTAATEPPPPETTTVVTTTTPPQPLEPDDVIPSATQTPKIEGNRLCYQINNVYSSGEYYTIEISAIHIPETTEPPEIETTYINGELYGDFRLDLLKNNAIIDTLKINVPRDDRFLIFESVTQNLTYGCELISNMRDFDAPEYPDLIQLDFHITNEAEVPQYARFFAISSNKLTEVPVYENCREAAPYGTHLDPKAAGLMVQHIVAKEYGSYTVKQYEYTFDPAALSMTRRRVQYTGYDTPED
ncbi:MAG: hypothetical protein ACI4WS_04475 [Oscillospiraceae bacterium]